MCAGVRPEEGRADPRNPGRSAPTDAQLLAEVGTRRARGGRQVGNRTHRQRAGGVLRKRFDHRLKRRCLGDAQKRFAWRDGCGMAWRQGGGFHGADPIDDLEKRVVDRLERLGVAVVGLARQPFERLQVFDQTGDECAVSVGTREAAYRFLGRMARSSPAGATCRSSLAASSAKRASMASSR